MERLPGLIFPFRCWFFSAPACLCGKGIIPFMPIYEYHCNACGADFEKLVFGSKPEVSCEKCGSKDTGKRLSRFGMGRSSDGPATGASSGG
ncbi:MAG TPA: zinc ribbon domain-containing protein, partial [Nitrospirota bacterium]